MLGFGPHTYSRATAGKPPTLLGGAEKTIMPLEPPAMLPERPCAGQRHHPGGLVQKVLVSMGLLLSRQYGSLREENCNLDIKRHHTMSDLTHHSSPSICQDLRPRTQETPKDGRRNSCCSQRNQESSEPGPVSVSGHCGYPGSVLLREKKREYMLAAGGP